MFLVSAARRRHCRRAARTKALFAAAAAVLLGSVGVFASPRAARAQMGATAPTTADAVRFLEQATFGPTKNDIEHVKQVGFAAYIDEQIAAPVSNYYYAPYSPNGYYGAKVRFFQNALARPDQLRQRVAFALSQVLAASGADTAIPSDQKLPAMVGYQEVLHQNALGNYRQVLLDMTLNPAMGAFLDMVNNQKPNPATNSLPNENYARELLQLFSVGVYKLNADGTIQVDVNNNPLPTYGNDEVKAFARVFTGWTYAPRYGQPMKAKNPANFAEPMVVYAASHDAGAKTLLGGQTLPAGQSAAADLDAAISNIFNHPNVGPFVASRLIQHLVTGEPSPGYVQRVAGVFNDNGRGVRGDLAAVVRAVLLDPEARGDRKTDTNYGHLREPALFAAALLRALNAQGDQFGVPEWASTMGQDVMSPRSVFSFYKPDYKVTYGPAGAQTSLVAPEVQTLATDTAIRRVNFVNTVIFGKITYSGKTGATADLSEFAAVAGNTNALLDLLSERFLHGTMSAAMRQSITTALAAIPSTAANLNTVRAQTALYLVLASTQYQVQQ